MFTPPEYDPQETKPQTSGEKTFSVIFVSVILGLFALELLQDFGPKRMTVLCFLAAWVVLTLIHEVGHALVAKLVGWRVHRLQVGLGPVVSQTVLQGVPVEIRLFPIIGLVEVTPGNLKSPRIKNALIYAAGPGIELAIAAVLTALVGWDVMFGPTETYGMAAIQATALAAVFGAGLNLLPFSPNPGTVTDGLGILLSPFLPRAHFERMMVEPVLEKGRKLLDEGQPAAAKRIFDEVIEHMPNMLLAHAGVARAQVDLGEGEFALLEFQAVVRALPEGNEAEAQKALDELREYIRTHKG
jgi:Zn-dependent protease